MSGHSRANFPLLSSKPGDVPPLTIVDTWDAEHKYRKKVPTTLVVRLKSNNVVKARLCVRGDILAGPSMHSFLPAPTAGRNLLRILLSPAASWKFRITTVDISQAFLQADKLLGRDKYLALPPTCLKLNDLKWDGHIQTDTSQQLGYSSRYAFLCHRPIYGSTDAPLRWYTTLARHIRSCGYLSHRTDMCTFSKRKDNKVVALIAVHVGDIIMAGDQTEILTLTACLSKFRHGPIQFIEEDSPVTYCGLAIYRKLSSFSVSQSSFRGNVSFICVEEFLGGEGNQVSDMDLRTAAKTMIGGLIWLLQTRFGISFWVATLATSIEPSIRDRTLLPEFIRNCDKVKKLLFAEDITVSYQPFAPQTTSRQPQLIVYADA